MPFRRYASAMLKRLPRIVATSLLSFSLLLLVAVHLRAICYYHPAGHFLLSTRGLYHEPGDFGNRGWHITPSPYGVSPANYCRFPVLFGPNPNHVIDLPWWMLLLAELLLVFLAFRFSAIPKSAGRGLHKNIS